MLETQILCLTYYSVSFNDALGRPFRDRRRLTVPGVATAADGLVALGCGTAQQWFDLCAMVGHDEWIDEQSELSITEQANIHATQIYEWVRDNNVDDILDLSTAFRIPNAPVGNGANVTSFDQFAERGTFVANPRDGFTQPGPPYRTTPSLTGQPQPAPDSASTPTTTAREREARVVKTAEITTGNAISRGPNALPFEGLRVLDMTSFWAGPSCTHVLAQLGAEVIHVESTARPDGTRLIAGVPVTEDQWWERSPIFSGLNTNKKSVTLDIRKPRGVELLHQLVTTCDVIVENYTPRVLDQIGLDFDTVAQLRPDAIMMRMPGFGLDGPWRDKPAFAYVIEDASGITWLTGHPRPESGRTVCGRRPERRRARAQRVDAGARASAPHRRGRPDRGRDVRRRAQRRRRAGHRALRVRQPAATPGQSRTDRGTAESLPHERARRVRSTRRLGGDRGGHRRAVGEPGHCPRQPGLGDRRAGNGAGRRRHHDEIDNHLGRWCAARTGDEIVETLWDAGVPVAKVMQPHRVGDLPQVVHRGFYEQVDHPVNPTARHSTLPMRISTGPQRFHGPPRRFSGSTIARCSLRLGLGEDEIAELEQQGIIGTAPADLGIRNHQDWLTHSDGHRSVGHPADGRVAVVTGGGSRASAAASPRARRLRRLGGDLGAGPGDLRVGGRRSARSGIPTDVRDGAAVDAALARTTDELGPVSILVNNAGGVFASPILETTENGWDALYRANLRHVLLCTQRVARRHGRGRDRPAASSTSPRSRACGRRRATRPTPPPRPASSTTRRPRRSSWPRTASG